LKALLEKPASAEGGVGGVTRSNTDVGAIFQQDNGEIGLDVVRTAISDEELDSELEETFPASDALSDWAGEPARRHPRTVGAPPTDDGYSETDVPNEKEVNK
jgi:hypothetical protein